MMNFNMLPNADKKGKLEDTILDLSIHLYHGTPVGEILGKKYRVDPFTGLIDRCAYVVGVAVEVEKVSSMVDGFPTDWIYSYDYRKKVVDSPVRFFAMVDFDVSNIHIYKGEGLHMGGIYGHTYMELERFYQSVKNLYNKGCQHDRKTYTGLKEVFDYCGKCGSKLP